MDHSVLEDESVLVEQTYVVSCQQQKVCCANCGSVFANTANLKRHTETKHGDQSAPAVIAKALKLQEYRKNNRCERRENDDIYRVKMQQTSRTNRLKQKAREAAAGCGTIDNVNPMDVPGVLDSTEIHIIEDSIEDSQTETLMTDTESDHVIGVSSNVKKAKKNDNPNSVFKVTTTVLTNETMTKFFTPKWTPPRTKEERKAAPRSSVV